MESQRDYIGCTTIPLPAWLFIAFEFVEFNGIDEHDSLDDAQYISHCTNVN